MFNAPKQNCMRNLERFRQSSILSKKPSALFPPKPSILEDIVVASECDNSNDVDACTETQTNKPKEIEMEPKEFMKNMDNSQELISLKVKLSKLASQLENVKRQNELLHSQLFNSKRFRNNDSAINFYTGFPNWITFMAVFKFLDPGDSGENMRYWLSSNVHEYFLVLCRLRQGFREGHLAHLFQISTSTVKQDSYHLDKFDVLKT